MSSSKTRCDISLWTLLKHLLKALTALIVSSKSWPEDDSYLFCFVCCMCVWSPLPYVHNAVFCLREKVSLCRQVLCHNDVTLVEASDHQSMNQEFGGILSHVRADFSYDITIQFTERVQWETDASGSEKDSWFLMTSVGVRVDCELDFVMESLIGWERQAEIYGETME